MKRIVIYLITALVVFVAALVFTDKYMTDSAIDDADRVNDLQVDNVQEYLDTRLLEWKQSSLIFLIGEMNTGMGDSSRIVMSDECIPLLKRTIYDDLKNFLDISPQAASVSFLMEPGIFEADGWGPTVSRKTEANLKVGCYDLADIYDYLHSHSYTSTKRSGKPSWYSPTKKSGNRGKTIIYQIPIYRETGQFAGVFDMEIDLGRLRNALVRSLPYGEEASSTTIVGNDGEFILTTNPFYTQYKNASEFATSMRDDWTSRLVRKNVHHHDVWNSDGKNYFVYHEKLIHAPWKILTVCNEDNVYASINKTRAVIISVSFFALLLILICLYLIFRHMQSNFRQKAMAEEELRMAAKVQMSLLRSKGNEAIDAFMRPAKETGGDLYEYVEKEGKLIFCIGDVSGKGMPAALFMTQVISLFRSAVRYEIEPSRIVARINDVLAADNPEMTFCTFFVGILSEDTLCFCNAGHNPPVLIPQSSAPSYMKVQPNLALGLMEGYQYKSETIPFPAGTRLVCYTDGVTEAMNRNHEQFGEKRLLSVLTGIEAHDNINTLITASLEQFVKGAPQSDDITIVTLFTCPHV